MMHEDQSGDVVPRCPNCRAINLGGTTICHSCGINIPAYNHVLKERHARVVQAADDSVNPVVNTAVPQPIEPSVEFNHHIRWLVFTAFGAIVLIVLGGLGYSLYRESRRTTLDAEYKTAVACANRQDYICARDGLFKIIQEDDTRFAQAKELLSTVRYELANQYAESGQWQSAARELEEALAQAPGHKRSITLLRNVYDRWLNAASASGDLLTVLSVRRQRDSRFPPSPTERPR